MNSKSTWTETESDHERGQSAALQAQILHGDLELARWDSFVTESSEVNPFATTTWCRAIGDTLGYGADFWIVAKGPEWLGGVPVFWRTRLGRPVSLQPAQCAYSSLFFSETLSRASYPSKVTSSRLDVAAALAKALAKQYGTARVKLLPAVTDVRAFQWAGWSVTPSYTYLIDLEAEMRCDHAVRKHVRKCRETGAMFSLDWQFDRFRDLAEDTIARQGLKSGMGMKYEEMEQIALRMRDAGLAWMATALTADGQALASRIELGIPGSSTLYDWVAGSSSNLFASGGNAWLMTKVAEEARRRGYSKWDLCGANYRNIAKFKSQLGGDLVHGWDLVSPRSRRERWYEASIRIAVKVKHMLVR